MAGGEELGGGFGTSREALEASSRRLVEAVLAEGGFPTRVTLSDGRWAWAAPDRRAWRPGRAVREGDINLRQSWPLPTRPVMAAPKPAPKAAKPVSRQSAKPAPVSPMPASPPAGERPSYAARLVATIGQLGSAGAPELAKLLGWPVEDTRSHLLKLGVSGALQGAGKNAAGDRLWRLSGKAVHG